MRTRAISKLAVIDNNGWR